MMMTDTSERTYPQAMRMPAPIFIIGAGRSGTSALTWALGQHPNIAVVPETNWIAGLVSHLGGFYALGASRGKYTHLSAFGVGQAAFFEAFGRTVDDLVRQSFEPRLGAIRSALRVGAKPPEMLAWCRNAEDPKQRWVDGTPANTPYAGLLADAFPAARFVHLLRDPTDVVRSLLGFAHRGSMFPDPASALKYSYHHTRAGHLAEASIGSGRAIRVFQREMAEAPEPMFRRLLEFLGEPYSADCLRPLQRRLNSSGQAAETVEAELRKLGKHEWMLAMRNWYAGSADPGWRISEPEEARQALAKYSRIAVKLPPNA